MKNKAYAVLLAGGKGTRLWPLSCEGRSKSFIRIGGEKPLITKTIAGLRGLIPKRNIIVVVDKSQKKFVKDIPGKNILVEPFGRSTASAIGLAALRLKSEDVMAVLPTDAIIGNTRNYKKTLRETIDLVSAKENVLACIGVVPRRPETAYGYIKLKSHRFIEKPNRASALNFFKRGNYLWNTGMFVFKAEVILKAIKKHAPVLHKQLMDIKTGKKSLKAAYRRMKNMSIDYQIMEKAKNLHCARGNFSWRDVGNWENAGALLKKDSRGNSIFGKAALVDTRGSVIYNSTKEKLGVVGLRDAIVVRTKNGTLVCSKKDAEKVKELCTSFLTPGVRKVSKPS